MNSTGLLQRLAPLVGKVGGKLPLCPWSSVLSSLDPRTLSAYPPPQRIEEVARSDGRKKLRFNNRHEAWFPETAGISPEMWSEYLGVFWEHPANAHRYLAHGTFVQPGDICLDCGSCEGFFALQALEAGAGKVICLEPSAEMIACLRLTFAEEIKTGQVVIHRAAAGAMNAEANFSFDQLNPFGGSLDYSLGKNELVPVQTIDQLCDQFSLPRLDFIKMDIEGAELQALEGAFRVLRRCKPALAVTTYHRSFDYAAFRTLIVAAGYRRISASGIVERDASGYRPVMLHARS